MLLNKNAFSQHDFDCLNFAVLDPVVQSIVSLMMSLRHKFVKQISAKVTSSAKDSHIFSTKNNSVFVILTFEILAKR